MKDGKIIESFYKLIGTAIMGLVVMTVSKDTCELLDKHDKRRGKISYVIANKIRKMK